MKIAKIFDYPDGQVCFINTPGNCTAIVSVHTYISHADLPPLENMDQFTQELADQVRADLLDAIARQHPPTLTKH